MTTQPSRLRTSQTTRPTRSRWQRLLALSGVAFAPLFVVGWLASAVSDSPNYIAAEQKWIKWAHHDHIKGRVSSFALVLAAFAFIYFLGALRSALEEAESSVRGSEGACPSRVCRCAHRHRRHHDGVRLDRERQRSGANADPWSARPLDQRSWAVLVGAACFSAFLLATGVLTLRTGVLSRWTGFVALIGAGCFFITLLTILNNSGNGSSFGYAFFPAMLSARRLDGRDSLARYRALAA